MKTHGCRGTRHGERLPKLIRRLTQTRPQQLLVAAFIAFATSAIHATTTLTVTKTADTNDGVCDADCSLREAIAAANDGDTINFSVTGAITLGSGELAIGKNITISGPGALSMAVDGNASTRVFHILSGETVTISGLTVRNGRFSTSSGGGGGGIHNEHATLTLINCAVTGNTANGLSVPAIGGGIFSDGANAGVNASLTLINCTVSGNTAISNGLAGLGGGIAQEGSSATVTLAITNCTFSGNTASGGGAHGGGIFSSASPTANASLSVNNSTFSGNTVSGGNSTGAGIYGGSTIVSTANTIYDVGQSPVASIASLGYNIAAGLQNPSNWTGPGDQINTDPNLGPLQNNGGQTSTHAPLCGSPAIDQGKNLIGVSTDQRGNQRTVDLPAFASFSGGDGTDVGAVESPVRTFAVTKAADTNDGICDADCSLREAIAAANGSGGIDLIALPASGVPINVSAGELLVTDCAVINGPGASLVTVSGNNNNRVFNIAPAIAVSMSGLTIANGSSSLGAGINNDHSTVLIDRCVVANNSAGGGGGILNDGSGSGRAATFTVSNSTLSGNVVGSSGGGILNFGGSGGNAVLIVTSSTLNNNNSSGVGGGIYNNGGSGNAALTINNSTLSGNGSASTTTGGGIHAFGNAPVTLNNSTFSGNSANAGGSVYLQSATLNTANTIFNAGSFGGTIFNSSGSVNSGGYNLASDNGGGFLTGTGDMINTDPQLGPLQGNGGPTATHALGTNSPAREAGNPSFDPNAFSPPMIYDQRGFNFPRVLGRLDIGAVELPAPLAFQSATSVAIHISPPNPPVPPIFQQFEINLPLSGNPGIECRNGDVGAVGGGTPGRHNIFFYFNNQISSTTNATVSCGTVTFRGQNGNPISVEFDGPGCNQQYVTVTLTGIQDSYGQTLASASVIVGLLLGDTTGDGAVNSADISQTKSRSGQTIGANNFRSDVTIDTSINSADISLVKSKSGTALP